MNIEYIIIIFILILIFLINMIHCRIIPTKKDLKLKIFDLLRLADDILRRNDIEYISEGGTLLGIVRHNGLIPWDDDADIFIMEKDYNKLLYLKDDFSQRNLVLKPVSFGFKIFSNENEYPFIDIFVRDKVGDKIVMSRTKSWKNSFFLDKEIYPIKRYKFGDLYLNGPKNPIPYLDRTYYNWRFILQSDRGHSKIKRERRKCLNFPPYLD